MKRYLEASCGSSALFSGEPRSYLSSSQSFSRETCIIVSPAPSKSYRKRLGIQEGSWPTGAKPLTFIQEKIRENKASFSTEEQVALRKRGILWTHVTQKSITPWIGRILSISVQIRDQLHQVIKPLSACQHKPLIVYKLRMRKWPTLKQSTKFKP